MQKIVAAAFFFMFIVGGASSEAVYRSPVRATWLWNPWLLVQQQDSVLAFLEEQQQTDLYLQVDEEVPEDVYRAFIRNATAKGIRVYALDGAPSWIEQKEELARFFRWVADYNGSASEEEKFAGVHLDIEPYLHDRFKTDREAAIAAYQALLLQAKEQAASLSLPFEVDIPFWYDNVFYHNAYGRGRLADWVIAQTDRVTMMAYRDTAEAIIDVVKHEMNIAKRYGKQVVVGVETAPTAEGDNVSFFEEGEAYMNNELAAVQAHYHRTASFAGIAVHHVEAWEKMRN